VSVRSVIAGALVIAVVCCLVMWMLEDFRQAKMIADFKAALEDLPTYAPPPRLPEP
jgi:hypothetical protein